MRAVLRRLLVATAALPVLVALPVAPAGPAGAQEVASPDGTVTVSTGAAHVGDRIVVDVSRVGEEVVTVSVCGNEARRGSVDCDQHGAAGVIVRPGQRSVAQMRVTAPPTTCPCVIRVNSKDSLRVVTVPFEVVGHPTGPLVDRQAVQLPGPLVRVRVTTPPRSFLDRVRGSLGGPQERTLVVDVTNQTSLDMARVVVVAKVAKGRGAGEPVESPRPFDLAAGATRRVELPMDLDAPTVGSYRVSVVAYGGGGQTTTTVGVTARPWLLSLLVVVVLVDVALIVVARRRRRSEPDPDDQEPLDDDEVSAGETDGEQSPVDPDALTLAGYGPS